MASHRGNDHNQLTVDQIRLLLKSKSANWYGIGREMGIGVNDRESIQYNQTLRSDEDRLESVIKKWVGSPLVVTRDALIEVLKRLEYYDVIRDMSTQAGGGNSGLSVPPARTSLHQSGSSGQHIKQPVEIPRYSKEDKMKIIRAKRPEPPAEELMPEVQEFCQRVHVVLHTVNEEEKWAVLKYMDPPVLPHEQDSPSIAEAPAKPIDLDGPNWITLGMFGGYNCAMVQTEMGANISHSQELEKALSKLPNAKVIIAIGVAYARNPDKAKLGDVLVSTTIDGVTNVKDSDKGVILLREGPTRWTKVSPRLIQTFARGMDTWYATSDEGFACTKVNDGESPRISEVRNGIIVSWPVLINNKDTRNKIMANVPEAIGGEMEGTELLAIKSRVSQLEHGIMIIKGVADYGDGNKNDKWQLTAALAAADYASHKLSLTKNVFTS